MENLIDLDFFDTSNLEYDQNTRSSQKKKTRSKKTHKKKKTRALRARIPTPEPELEEEKELVVPEPEPRIYQKYPDLYNVFIGRKEMKTECVWEIVRGIDKLQKGTSLFKWRNSGGGFHWKYFQLSPDCKKLVWFSTSKKFVNTQISINNIRSIDEGFNYYDFQYFSDDLSDLGLTIHYMNQKSSANQLSVICKSYRELQIWKKCLEKLMVNDSNPDVKILVKYRSKSVKGKVPTLKNLISNFDNNQKYSKYLTKCEKIFHKLKEKSCACRLLSYIHTLKETFCYIDDELTELRHALDEHDYALCQKIAWLLEIQLQTLEEKVKVLNK